MIVRLLRWLVQCLFSALCGVLGLLLVAQIVFFAYFTLGSSLPIPESWVAAAVERRVGGEWDVETESLRVDRKGRLSLDRLSLRNASGREVARVRDLSIDFFLPALLLGILDPESVRLGGAALFDPQAPLGSARPLVLLDGLDLRREGIDWRVEDFRFRWGRLPVAVSGSFPSRRTWWLSLARDAGQASGEAPLRPLVLAWSALQEMEDGMGYVRLWPGSGGRTEGSLRLSAAAAELPGDLRLAGEAGGEVRFAAAPGKVRLRSVRIGAERLSWRGEVGALRPRLRWLPDSAGGLVGSWEGRAAAVEVPGLSTGLTVGEAVLGPTGRVDFAGYTHWGGRTLRADGRVDALTGAVRADLRGRAPVEEIRGLSLWPGEIPVEDFHFATDPYLEVTAAGNFRRGGLERLDLFVRSGPLDLAGVRGQRAVGELSWEPGRQLLRAPFFLLDTGEYELSGHLRQETGSARFLLGLEGGFRPMDIDPWMGPGWERTWSGFSLGETPEVNLSLRGDWTDPQARWLEGSVRFADTRWLGLRAEEGEVRVRAVPGFLGLRELFIRGRSGEASGRIDRWFPPGGSRARLVEYDLESSLPLREVRSLTSGDLRGFLERIEPSEPPRLVLRGIAHPLGSGPGLPPEDLRLTADLPAPVRLAGIGFGSLAFAARYDGARVVVPQLEAGLGGGVLSGQLDYRLEGPRANALALDLELADATPPALAEALPLDLAASLANPGKGEGSDPGEVNLSFRGTGNPERPRDFLGEGTFRLRTESLPRIRLFGIFSRISELLPLPITLGSLGFDELETEFRLRDGLLTCRNLSLTGPSSRLRAEGTYDYSEDTIDMRAYLQLLGGTNLPLLSQLGSLLFPVERLLAFRVWGSRENPSVRLEIDPRNLGGRPSSPHGEDT